MATLSSDQLLTCEIIMKGSVLAEGGSAKNFANVFHFQRTTNVNPVNKAHIEASFQTNIATPILAALSLDYAQTTNSLRFLEDATDPYQDVTESTAGSITGERLPDYNAVVIRLYGNVRGKSARGSKHFGPLGESQSNGDTLVSSAVTLFQAVGAAIVAGFTDSDGNVWLPVILSRKYSILGTNPTTVKTFPVTSYMLNKTTGSMRRRKSKTVVA
jgi:hypothetical protein